MVVNDDLRTARRAILDLHEFELIEDFVWYPTENGWLLQFNLKFDSQPHPLIPQSTAWCALVSNNYPKGDIDVFPAKVAGITATFQHQSYNSDGNKLLPWRDGLICLKVPGNIWSRVDMRNESFEPEERLRWHIIRAIDWIKAASEGRLVNNGDYFELPPFPTSKYNYYIAFNESAASYIEWQHMPDRGLLKLKSLPGNTQMLVITEFSNRQEKVTLHWGNAINHAKKEVHGLWLKLPKIPVKQPWEIPKKWNELLEILQEMNIDLKEILCSLWTKNIKLNPTVLLIGFNIPEKIGAPESVVHWYAIELTVPSRAKGFHSQHAILKHTVNIQCATGKNIPWINTINWHKDQITTRGRMPIISGPELKAIIGVGAIGSQLAESLIRLGCERLLLIDPDVLDAGNIARHTLTMQETGMKKAKALAQKLNNTFPFAQVSHESISVEQVIMKKPSILDEAKIIFEVTGSDEVLRILKELPDDPQKQLVSISTDAFGDRLYCFITTRANTQKSIYTFYDKMEAFLVKDRNTLEGKKLPQESIGCWNPISPIRLDDIQMLLGAAIKPMENAIENYSVDSLIVIHKTYNEKTEFTGVHIESI